MGISQSSMLHFLFRACLTRSQKVHVPDAGQAYEALELRKGEQAFGSLAERCKVSAGISNPFIQTMKTQKIQQISKSSEKF